MFKSQLSVVLKIYSVVQKRISSGTIYGLVKFKSRLDDLFSLINYVFVRFGSFKKHGH